jgi:hypothetical protein
MLFCCSDVAQRTLPGSQLPLFGKRSMLQLRLSPFSKIALRMRRKLPQRQRQSHAANVSIFPARLSTVQRPNCLPVKSINALNFSPVHVHWQTKRACVRIVPPCTRLIDLLCEHPASSRTPYNTTESLWIRASPMLRLICPWGVVHS